MAGGVIWRSFIFWSNLQNQFSVDKIHITFSTWSSVYLDEWPRVISIGIVCNAHIYMYVYACIYICIYIHMLFFLWLQDVLYYSQEGIIYRDVALEGRTAPRFWIWSQELQFKNECCGIVVLANKRMEQSLRQVVTSFFCVSLYPGDHWKWQIFLSMHFSSEIATFVIQMAVYTCLKEKVWVLDWTG